SPEIRLPKPRRLPWRGAPLGKNPTPSCVFETKCRELGRACADPEAARTAAVAMAAAPAASPSRRRVSWLVMLVLLGSLTVRTVRPRRPHFVWRAGDLGSATRPIFEGR